MNEELLNVNVALELETGGNNPMWIVHIYDNSYDDKFFTFNGFPVPNDLGKDLIDFLERHYVRDMQCEDCDNSVVSDCVNCLRED